MFKVTFSDEYRPIKANWLWHLAAVYNEESSVNEVRISNQQLWISYTKSRQGAPRWVVSRTNSRKIIGRNPSMVIPLLANQELTPMLVEWYFTKPREGSPKRAIPRVELIVVVLDCRCGKTWLLLRSSRERYKNNLCQLCCSSKHTTQSWLIMRGFTLA